jgi:hypothetical protein
MKTDTQNIFDRLTAAAVIMREHSQYSDDEFEHNGEGLAADACDDAAALINHLAAALSRAESALTWFVEDKGEPDTEALTEAREALERVNQ